MSDTPPREVPETLRIPEGFHVASLPLQWQIAQGPDLVTLFLRYENALVGASFDAKSALQLAAALRTNAEAARILGQPKLVVPGLVIPGTPGGPTGG